MGDGLAASVNGSSTRRQIGEKTFTSEEQEFFADMSLDVNPMHMDSVIARRLFTGRQVVHGINLLLNAIEFWLHDYKLSPTSVKCSFINPVNVGDHVSFEEISHKDGEHTIEVSVGGLSCCKIILGTKNDSFPQAPSFGIDGDLTDLRTYSSIKQNVPMEMVPGEQLGKRYVIQTNPVDINAKFPLVSEYFSEEHPLALAALSYFVGMVCPGMHSIFSSLRMKFIGAQADRKSLLFSIEKFDERFGLFSILVKGPVEGEIKAFLRPPPYRQNSVEDLKKYTKIGEFSGTTSLIIGGSRGLGELTAKILASGGGNTIITYAQGLSDARIVSDDINADGSSNCEILKFDLLQDSIESLGLNIARLQAVYFFATPRIFRKKSVLFDPHLFDEFFESYVKKFHSMCLYLESNLNGKIKIFFPSTIFVESRPREFTEYAMAKAAAEVLISDANRSFKKVFILTSRLPRLNTDQTSSILKLETESNVSVMLPIVRSMLENL